MTKYEPTLLYNIILGAKKGDTEFATILLQDAAKYLCGDSAEGKLLREYIQDCLKKIVSPHTGRIFPDKTLTENEWHELSKKHQSFNTKQTLNEKKTAFFNAFNLGQPNKRPKSAMITIRNKQLTWDYINLILSGNCPTQAIEIIRQQYFKEKNLDDKSEKHGNEKYGSEKYGSERSIRRIVSDSKENLIQDIINISPTHSHYVNHLVLLNYLKVIAFVFEIKRWVSCFNKKEKNKYFLLNEDLSIMTEELQKELLKTNHKKIACLLNQILKKLESYSPEFEKYTPNLNTLKKQFKQFDIKKVMLTNKENKTLRCLFKIFFK